MTISARNWAWDVYSITLPGGERPLLPGEKLTLLCLAEHENAKYGIAYPSQERIATRTQQSVRTVRRHLGVFETVGAITRSRGRHAGKWDHTVYELDVPAKYRTRDPEWMKHQGLPDTVSFPSERRAG